MLNLNLINKTNSNFSVIELMIIMQIYAEYISVKMELAVSELYADYANDKELTAFTELDLELFYETK